MPETYDEPASWPVSSSRDLHRDDWVVALRADQVHRPGHEADGSFRRLVVEHPGASMVIALDDRDRVLCLRQYRHAARMRFVELPAGLLDAPGEDPLDVAVRELREEAAMQASEWTHLLSVWASPGISAERHHIYLATGLSSADRGDFVLEHEEADMELFWLPFEDLLGAVLDGRVSDAPVALAVLAVHARRSRGSGR